jgi:CDGSH iron-sulfur domain-containing protein 3
MSESIVAKKGSFPVDVEEGKTYFWCACGRSKSQPFCDGSHKEFGMSPEKWVAPATKTAFFCGCKKSGRAPLCDGTHSKI